MNDKDKTHIKRLIKTLNNPHKPIQKLINWM